LASLGAAVGGAAIVILGSGGLDISTAGILFAFGSSLAFSLSLIAAHRMVRHTESLTAAMWVAVAAGAALAVVSVIVGVWQWPSGANQWGPVLGAGVLPPGGFFRLFPG